MESAPSMLRRDTCEDLDLSPVAPGLPKEQYMCCLPARRLAWCNQISNIGFLGAYSSIEVVHEELSCSITFGARYEGSFSIGYSDVHFVQTGKFGIELEWVPRLRGNRVWIAEHHYVLDQGRNTCCLYSNTVSKAETPPYIVTTALTASPWPTFAFTAPITRGYSLVRPSAKTSEIDCTSMRSPHCVPVPCIST